MTRAELANHTHDSGFNCCQSVCMAFADELDLERSEILKMCSAFGGGMQCGEMCGAITGALMVLGLKTGFDSMDIPEVKDEMGERTKSLLAEFKSAFGAFRCKELLGFDYAIPEERILAKASGVPQERCPGYITGATEILERFLNL